MRFRPIFIGGCDRSGTTMLGDILGAADGACATPESQFLHELLLMLQVRAFNDTRQAARWLRSHFRYAVWDMDLDDNALADKIDLGNGRVTAENLLSHYFSRHRSGKPQPVVWVDHTPDNFKYYAVLRATFPDASFIHIVRDGRAVFSSIKALDWGPNNAYMGTRFWSERLHQALAVEMSEGTNARRVRYEDLLDDPDAAMASLCAFTKLPFAARMVEGGGLVVPAFTRGQHQLVGRRPDPRRRDEWRSRLSPREIAEFEAWPWSRVLLKSFDYPLLTSEPLAISTPIVLLRYVDEFVRYLLNRRHHRAMEDRTLAGSN